MATQEEISDAHQVMQQRQIEPGNPGLCGRCGETDPCSPRVEARRLLVNAGRLALADGSGRHRRQ